jgi:hypothetical protein
MQNYTHEEDLNGPSLDIQFESSIESLEGFSDIISQEVKDTKKPWEVINSQTETRTFKAQYAVQKAHEIKKRNLDLTDLLRKRAQELWDNPDEFFNTIH